MVRIKLGMLIIAALACGFINLSAPVSAGDWTDGFNGSVGNWSLRTGTAMTYSTDVNHGTYTGTGAMKFPTSSSEMYRSTGSRPYHAGKATATFYDGVRWRAGVCGNQYRQLLGFAASSYSVYQLSVGHYSAGGAGNFFRRDSGGSYTSIGAKGARTSCSAGWVYFEIEFKANGDCYRRADDGVVNLTHTLARSSGVINAGIGMVTLGLGASSTNTGYWDDITWDGYDPGTPTGIAATAQSTSSINWTANAASDNNQFGFALMNGGSEVVVSPTNARQTSASLTETGLSANTSYTRAIRAWNGDNNSSASSTASKYTLIETPATPTFGTVSYDSIVINTSGCSNYSTSTSGLYFDSTTSGGDGGINSWVQALTDTATGLSTNTQYTFQVKARNGDSVETAYSGSAAKYTLIETPTGVSFGTVTETSIDASPTGTLSNLTSGSSGVRVSNTTASNDSGWETDNSGYTSSSLTPNTNYSFVARARNGDATETGDSSSATKYTLAAAPSAGNNVSCSKNTGQWYNSGSFVFSNPADFGAGTHGGNAYRVTKFRYVWDTNPTYSFNGTESEWTSSTLTQNPSGDGTYYLHLQSLNEDGVATSTTLDYGPFQFDATPPQVSGSPSFVSASSPYGGNVTMRWANGSYSDATSNLSATPLAVYDGVSKVSSDLAGSATSAAFSDTSGEHTYTLKLEDNAGNTADVLSKAVAVPSNAGTPWIFGTPATTMAAPAVYLDSLLSLTKVAASGNGKVYAVTADDADPLWEPQTLGGAVQGRMPIATLAGTLTVLAGGQDGNVYARDVADGSELWTHDLGSGFKCTAKPGGAKSRVISGGYSGDVVFAVTDNLDADNFLRAIKATDGTTLWTYQPTGSNHLGPILGAPLVVNSGTDGTVYFSTMTDSTVSGKVYAVNMYDGTLKWVSSALEIKSSLGQTQDSGKEIVGVTQTGSLYAFNASNGNVASGFPVTVGSSGIYGAPFYVANKDSVIVSSNAGNAIYLVPMSGSSPTWTQSSISGPSAPIEYRGLVYVGSTDGKLYQLDIEDGSIVASKNIDTSTPSVVGDPVVDAVHSIIYVGASNGRVYAFDLLTAW